MSRRTAYTLLVIIALAVTAPLWEENAPLAIGILALTLISIGVEASRAKDGTSVYTPPKKSEGEPEPEPSLFAGGPPTTPPPAPAPGKLVDKEEATEESKDERARYSASEPDEIMFADVDDLESESLEEEAEEPDSPGAAEAHFTAYYPRESAAETAYGLYVYAHIQDALQQVQQDVATFEEQLGGQVPRPSKARAAKMLEFGTVLTVLPEADGLEFEPVAEMRRWRAPFVRFDFTYRAPKELVGEIVTGRIAILVAGIEVANISFATLVEEPSTIQADDARPQNPLAAAKFESTDPAQIYDTIFISYSRKDKEVAENYRLAQLAVGHEVFMDTYSIRTGEDWRAALARAIDKANIFQLFWSEHSAGSENVRDEWDYALQYKCPDDQCDGFIRPVFWEKPMPSPPQELGHLNFRFVPFVVNDEKG